MIRINLLPIRKLLVFHVFFLNLYLLMLKIVLEKEIIIRTDIDEIDYDIATFNQFKSQCISSGQLSHSRLHVVLQNCFDFTLAIGKSLENRFPEMKFVLKNLSFLNPSNRKHSKCDIEVVVHKFCSEKVEVQTTKLQYSSYRNDDSLDFVFLNCDKHADVFFHQLSQMPEYSQFGLLAQTLLCMSPDTVECECGFSRMNLTKNKFSIRLVQSNLDAQLTVSMDKRSLSTFPGLRLIYHNFIFLMYIIYYLINIMFFLMYICIHLMLSKLAHLFWFIMIIASGPWSEFKR